MTEKQRTALMTDLHRQIESAAVRAAQAIVGSQETPHLTYPPNGGLTPVERAALTSLTRSPALDSALRRVVADAAADAIFHLFCLLDGVADPINYTGTWMPLPVGKGNADGGMLHDEFMGSYWEWRSQRPDAGWRLDNFEDASTESGRE